MSYYTFRVRDFHLVSFNFPDDSTTYNTIGCSLFARHYSGNNYCYLFLWVLRCFSSPRLRFHVYSSNIQVFLFGHLRIITYLQFPVAFRSLSRPSSPLGAKASSIRPYKLLALKTYWSLLLYFFFSRIVNELFRTYVRRQFSVTSYFLTVSFVSLLVSTIPRLE